ncbi:hypothetical protein GCM10022237_15210 [Nocardioides ginsengisoli]|uniref:Glycosyltransferase n=1 Tax=Nocardioides ginsengisoli TaxID=363868 RepID=A0ABW3W1F8_9ACTN
MAEVPKVSVLIPTYRSGPGLDRAIASLDAQTLPQHDLEVLLLDDGSPDDTYARIAAIAAQRPHYRAFELEASGWPSRPRNIGVREARGEYVLFMDHDDELYPDALRAAYDFGVAAGADVVNGKETRTNVARWGLGTYTEDLADATDRPLRGLLPMTPHKLYRRAFLVEHDVRFPEAPRHLWEDIFFHIDLLEHRATAALLSSTPFYHWRHTGENNSAADGEADYRGGDDYWPYLDKLLAKISALTDPAIRTELLAHTTHARLLPQIGHRDTGRTDDEVAADRAEIERLLAAYVPVEVDPHLPPRARAAITLLRDGHADAAAEFLRDGAQRRPEYTVTAVEDAGDGSLTVTGTVAWTPAPQPFARRTADGAVVRGLPEPIASLLAERGLSPSADVDDVQVDLMIRHAPTRVAWLLPTTSAVALVEQPDGTLEPAGTFRARFDPATAAMGHALPRGGHQLLGRCELDGRTGVKRAFSELPEGTRIGPVVLGYSGQGGLALRLPAEQAPEAAAEVSESGWVRRLLPRRGGRAGSGRSRS